MAKASAVTGIILAGGSSQRMGRAKAFLPWGGTTLIERVIATLRPITSQLLVVVKDARAFGALDAQVVKDLIPNAHALGGLYTGLALASSRRSFVCACDNPFVNPSLVRFLCEQFDGVDVVIPRTADGLQPLHAVYAPSALPAIELQLRERCWNLRALVPRLRTRIVEPQQWRLLDPHGLSFWNLNTPADYAQAQQLMPIQPAVEVR